MLPCDSLGSPGVPLFEEVPGTSWLVSHAVPDPNPMHLHLTGLAPGGAGRNDDQMTRLWRVATPYPYLEAIKWGWGKQHFHSILAMPSISTKMPAPGAPKASTNTTLMAVGKLPHSLWAAANPSWIFWPFTM